MESKHSLRKPKLFRTLLILLFMAVPLQWATAQLTLSTPRTTLGAVIKQIQSQSKYQFFYNDKLSTTAVDPLKVKDASLEQVLNKLKELGIYDNTIIIFTSDNGPTFNGGSDSFFFDSAKPFKSEWGWGKASLREGGIRVPMIASWPKKIKAGSKSDLICAFWDIMPTFCEIAKVECPTTDGISFLPELLGKKQNKHDFLYWEFPDSGGQKAVRMGKWKGIVLNIFKGNRKIQLYDLDSDPREQTDVARYHPEIVKRMEDIMKQEHIEPELASFKMPH